VSVMLRNEGAMYVERTARKLRRCDCPWCPLGRVIEPGQRYVHGSLPPGRGDVGNATWWHSAFHADCISPAPTS